MLLALLSDDCAQEMLPINHYYYDYYYYYYYY